MNFKDSTNLQKISSCGISLFGGLGIYLAAANHLGIARLPALLIALTATFILLFVYRLLLKSAANWPENSWIYLLPALAIVFIISINYSGLINLWRDMAVNETPFIIYSLLAASLLLLAGWKGERALWRACPIICAIVIAAIIFDTIFVLPKADPALLLSKVDHSFNEVLLGGGEMAIFLLAPLLIFCIGIYLDESHSENRFPGRYLAIGLIFPAIYLLVELLRNLLLFGDLITLDQYPILRALKSVDFGVGVSRLEFLGVTALSAGLIIALMLEFAILVRISQKVFAYQEKGRKISVVVLTALIVVLSSIAYLYGTEKSFCIIGMAAVVVLFAYPLIMMIKNKYNQRSV